MRRCASNFCQDSRKAGELTTNTQRVASTLDVYSEHAESTMYAKTNPTHVQRVTRPERMARACSAGHAL